MSRLKNIQHLMRFILNRKRLWLLPVCLLLIVMGIFFIFTQGTVLSPFVYTLF